MPPGRGQGCVITAERAVGSRRVWSDQPGKPTCLSIQDKASELLDSWAQERNSCPMTNSQLVIV